MDLQTVAIARLQNQRITKRGPAQPAALVAWLGAVQAQDLPAVRWALGLRLPDHASATGIQRALDEGRILRTHVLRPTWHFVAPDDIRWMLELTAPRIHRAMAHGLRHVELDTTVCTRAAAICERALRGGDHLTRAELADHLARGGIAAKGIRLALLSIYAELEQVMCSGAMRGTQQTYALLAARAPQATRLSRDEALAELTTRYFRSHGPATVRDFVWWSGLTVADAKRGLEIIRACQHGIDGYAYWTCGDAELPPTHAAGVHLLPIYDEYIVAYRDYHAVPRPPTSYGLLPQAVVVGGQVAGIWKAIRGQRPAQRGRRDAERSAARDALVVEVTQHRALTPREQKALKQIAACYGQFVDAATSVRLVKGPAGLRRR